MGARPLARSLSRIITTIILSLLLLLLPVPNNSNRLAKKSYGVVDRGGRADGPSNAQSAAAAEIVIFRACSQVCWGGERERGGGREGESGIVS